MKRTEMYIQMTDKRKSHKEQNKTKKNGKESNVLQKQKQMRKEQNEQQQKKKKKKWECECRLY